MKRCSWANLKNPLYIEYHDTEWGVPVTDDRELFEFLILEGAQAGLSWETILNKREAYREVFAGFDPVVVATFDQQRIEKLLSNPGIVRNKLKVAGAVRNAQAFLKVQAEHGSFAKYLWEWVANQPEPHRFATHSDIPTYNEVAVNLSKDLKKRGFTFVGPTIMYAFMQAVGMVNDHTVDCFRYTQIPTDIVTP